jgi:outer membrane lipopolysaccharide assembly protein LptE/RlpB
MSSLLTQTQAVRLHDIGRASLALAVLVVMVGCGYHSKGMGLTAPPGVRTIAVTVLENRTSESGIETRFTSNLVYEFTRSKILQVVDRDKADAVLSGMIVSLKEDTVSYTAGYDSNERRVTITLDLALKGTDGKVIWSRRHLSDREAFKVLSDRLATERNRRAAIEVMSERLAERVHNAIFQDF